jgi:putative ABC transport system permease protein
MYTAVLERTKEIGIMKAVGATNEAVLSIFLVESGLLGLAGAVVGVVLGLGISFGTAFAAQQALGTNIIQAYVSVWLIVGGLLFGFLLGALAGYLPARQAANMKPVDSLRYE